MYISSIAIKNYKSFRDSEPIRLEPGINIVTGQNDAGKTALLEALALDFEYRPHRSTVSIPVRSAAPPSQSSCDFDMTLSADEIQVVLREQVRQFYVTVPAPPPRAGIPSFRDYQDSTNIKKLLRFVLAQPTSTIKASREIAPGAPSWRARDVFAGPIYEANRDGKTFFFAHCTMSEAGELGHERFDRLERSADLAQVLAQVLAPRIYRFSAQRRSSGVCKFGESALLRPTTENLPEVLNSLKQNDARWRRYLELVQEVLPHVRGISVFPRSNQTIEIGIWGHDETSEREDLAVPLQGSGTGIGQVLAILYVLITAEFPRVIIVDEPNSFLHPGAVRKLIEIFRRFHEHQYILSTHSPMVISAAEPATITLLRKQGAETVFEQFDRRKVEKLQLCLDALGARLSDVFGADRVLWVEGRTEEHCFPIIARRLGSCDLRGTVIVGVTSTSDLERRDAKKFAEMYRRLAQAGDLVPRPVAAVLDRECLSPERRDALTASFLPMPLQFLGRRMFENYLLHSEAIAAVMNGIAGFRDPVVTASEVDQWLLVHLDEEKYWKPLQRTDFAESEVSANLNASQLLMDIFAALSETRVTYVKTEHGPALVEKIIEVAPHMLKELVDLLSGLLGPPPAGP